MPEGFSASLFSIEAHGDALVPCDLSGKPSLPERTDRHRPAGHWLAEILVPKSAKAGRYTIRLAAGCEVPLEVWDFALPDRLSFVPQMNAYGLPDGQETAYYRMAHEHRTCLNCLRYSWQGRVSDGCAPQVAADGSWDWTAWDRRFGPLLNGSAFADLPRGRTPVDNFYLPLNENWPMDHERAYRGGYWIENAYPESYWAEFRTAGQAIRPAHRGKGMGGHDLRVLPQQQGLLQGRARLMVEMLRAVDLRRAGQHARLLGLAAVRPRIPGRDRRCGNLVFRCDISRPEWQRDLLDGVCGEEVVSGAPAAVSRPHPGPAGAVRANGLPLRQPEQDRHPESPVLGLVPRRLVPRGRRRRALEHDRHGPVMDRAGPDLPVLSDARKAPCPACGSRPSATASNSWSMQSS